MNIVIASSEAAPYAVSGDLGDSVSRLAESLVALGHRVTLIVPHHPSSIATYGNFEDLARATVTPLQIRVGTRTVAGAALKLQKSVSRAAHVGEPHCEVVLIDQADYFNRPNLYQDAGRDYRDNCERFVFFSRAVVEVVKTLDTIPDVIHCHDWETGLIPALLKIEHRQSSSLRDVATVLTIHNLQFQGQFWHWDMELTGLEWKYFNWRQMEYFGQLNLLKTGIVFADAITVSTREFAKAIQTSEFGCGLHGVLRQRSEHLIGISGGTSQILEVYRHALRHDAETYLCLR